MLFMPQSPLNSVFIFKSSTTLRRCFLKIKKENALKNARYSISFILTWASSKAINYHLDKCLGYPLHQWPHHR